MKFIKFILIVVCIIAVGLVSLVGCFSWLESSPMVPLDYVDTVKTGGDIEAKYIKKGSFEIAYFEEKTNDSLKKYEIYYPKELETTEKKYPVVVFTNGTGVAASKYVALFEHLASWGFVVIGNEEPETWSGISSDKSIGYLLEQNEKSDSRFYQKIDVDNIGITGHSQGGAGVFNAITECKNASVYKTAVSLSPTNEEQAISMKWHYDLTQINIPLMIVAGTKGDFETQLVIPIEKMIEMYNKIPSDKVMMRKTGYEHGEMLYVADGYVTAWLMWQLQNDNDAAKAFTGDTPEIMNNKLYQDQKIDLPR